MMGVHQPQPELFSYQVNLERRVRPGHPLRQVAQARSVAARRNRGRRQYLLEGSFADAANNHGFKRSR